MTRTAAFDALGSEFDAFLYAPIAREHNGMDLSVLSALARLGLDPWEQAARWARQSQETAADSLASLLAALPAGPTVRPDPQPLAARLIALLPRRDAHSLDSGLPASRSFAGLAPPARARTMVYLLVYLVLSLFMLCSQWIFRDHPAHSPIPTPAAISSTTAVPAHWVRLIPSEESQSVTPPGS
jgi:hypothetical protein